MSETLTIQAATPSDLRVSNPDNVFGDFQEKSFIFPHRLANDPLFSLDSLIAFAERSQLHTGWVSWQTGKVEFGDGWFSSPQTYSLRETFDNLSHNDSFIVIKHAEQDPVIGPALQAAISQMFDYFPKDKQEDIVCGESIIFITSPRRRTAYHMDLESSFLLQVSGKKVIHVFNQKDRSLVTEQEIASLCCGNQDAAIYRPERQHEATSYVLEPGVGVHFPSTAPHAVQNDENISISININFDHRSLHQRLRPLCKFNHRLRRFGLNPMPLGGVQGLDNAKVLLEKGLSQVRSLKRSTPASPQWLPPQR